MEISLFQEISRKNVRGNVSYRMVIDVCYYPRKFTDNNRTTNLFIVRFKYLNWTIILIWFDHNGRQNSCETVWIKSTPSHINLNIILSTTNLFWQLQFRSVMHYIYMLCFLRCRNTLFSPTLSPNHGTNESQRFLNGFKSFLVHLNSILSHIIIKSNL